MFIVRNTAIINLSRILSLNGRIVFKYMLFLRSYLQDHSSEGTLNARRHRS